MSDPPDRPPGMFERMQRNGWLVAAVAITFVIGMPLTRLLESWRGVVLRNQDGQHYVAADDAPPRLKPACDAPPGGIVEKARGAWTCHGVEARGRDIKLKQMYERYVSAYQATIVRIDPPLGPGQASVAVAETTSGRRVRVPLFAEGLAGAAVGRRLQKLPESWDPVLVDAPDEAPP